jgi:hypothetical protein
MAVDHSEHSPLIIVAAPPVVARMLSVLRSADIPALAVTSVPAARELLLCGRPRGLFVTVHLGAHNGLQVVHMARQLHHGLPKIVFGEADPILEAEAERAGATYITEPVCPAEIVAIARRLLRNVWPPRRSRRVRLGTRVAAIVNGYPSQIVDIGYGGIGLDVPNEATELPSAFDVHVPAEGVTLRAERVWQHTNGARLRCGGIATHVAPAIAAEWKALVDRVRLNEWRRVLDH